ncbi:MAG: accessory gene regulator B family protein [Eubacterium sp.]|uniref:accessory gene regulator ArgB-like protein n=1 Tax=Eubacterium sp. TaxID=142586 RepID=UPI00300F2998
MRCLSEYIVTWLIKHKAILNEDRELYEYATYSFFLTTFPIIISIIIGSIMGKILESILFIVTFMSTRKYSGGFHARHAWVCIISSWIILFVCIYIIANIKYNIIFDIGMLCAAIGLIIFSPIDNENRRLDLIEKKEYKSKITVIVLISVIIYFALILINKEEYAVCISVGIMLSACLQIPCILQKCNRKINENRLL